MGKPKKGKRGDVSDDDESLTTVDAVPASKKAEKKKKGKKGRGDDSDSEAENVAEDAPAAKKKEKKKDKKKGKKKQDSDDESGDEDVVQTKLSKAMKNVKISDGEEDEEPAPKVPQPAKKTAGQKSAFAMLTSMDSDVDAGESDDAGAESDDNEPEPQPAPKQKAKEKKQPKEQEPKEVETGKKGKKNKGGKKEEDLDELFAEFGIEVKEKESKKKKKKKKKGEEDEDEAGAEDKPEEPTTEQLIESKEAKVVAPEDLLSDEEEESRKDRRKKKKGKQKEEKVEPAAEDEEQAEEGEDEDGGVKTAAQKRKEKKERERLKKLEEKQKAAEKAQPGAPKTEPPKAEEAPKTQDVEVAADEAPKEDGAAEEEQKDDKKSKKDKKKKDKDKKAAAEEDDKKKKGPSKKVLIAMQEQLKKIQEQEETARRAEEERIRREEEAEEARLEKVRLEKERREREKAKKKDRITRQKQKGTYLTPKQKEQRARAQAMLEMLKAQGAMIPALSKDAKIDEDDEQEDEDIEDDTSSQASATAKSVSAKAPAPQADKAGEGDAEPKVDTIKESWDEGEDEVKDSWEDVAAEIVPAEKHEEPVAKQAKLAPKEEPAEAEESSEESESEEESSEESESETESEESDEEESKKTDAERRFDRALARIEKRRRENEAKRSTDVLRQPVVCVLGHVDTGKTKILDKLRRTNVQEGEAGGITQQIGATNVPLTAIEEQCKMVHEFDPKTLKIPGLLIIDTPGHESFSNLRSRGSSLCDIAVLVVDIMHGLEPQTIESINLLKKGKTPFIIALNKIDRLYDWKSNRHKDVRDVINAQAMNTRLEFQKRTQEVIVGMAEQGLNAALFFENPDPRTYLSMIPTSAVNGDGMGNLMGMLVNLTQNMLAKRIAFSDELQATVLEVKAIAGLGTTVDVILVNGTLREGDTMIIAGTEGPIATQIRSLLMPQPMKELRVKNSYKEYKEVRAAQGVKVCAKDLEKTIAGLNLLVANSPDEVEVCKKEVARELKKVLSAIKLQDRGVYVIASTLGSLEALLEFLKGSQIPYSGIRIGPVAKRDVMRASVQLEHDSQYAVILAFDVKVEREAQELADSLRVRIFRADIIYHLFDQFMAYREDLRQKRRRENEHLAVFPCKLRILPQFIFNTRDPIVVGVSIEAGLLKVGTPLCVPSKEFVDIGVVTSIEINNKQMEVPAKKGQEVCIKIENRSGDAPRMFGRHFEASDTIVSRITRESIDACKEFFRDDLGKPDWQLMIELKKQFQIL